MIPTFYMLVGLPGCGKSMWADNMKYMNNDIIVHSSDKIREEVLGDVNDQSKNSDIFNIIHERIINDLKSDKTVIFDATNLKSKNRISILSKIDNEKIPCFKVCIHIVAPLYKCIGNNNIRERQIPAEVIKRMHSNYQPPTCEEGFDYITYIFNGYEASYYTLEPSFEDKHVGYDYYDQENPNHKLTLGHHCKKAYQYIMEKYPWNYELATAALLHDIGKEFVKTDVNSKGEKDGMCHYYNHENVSAYESLFYSKMLGFDSTSISRISNLIYFHMKPYSGWEKSKNALKRDTERYGTEFINNVLILNQADRYAH